MKIGIIVWSIIIFALCIAVLGWGTLLYLVAFVLMLYFRFK